VFLSSAQIAIVKGKLSANAVVNVVVAPQVVVRHIDEERRAHIESVMEG
jgi:hypothetical protein